MKITKVWLYESTGRWFMVQAEGGWALDGPQAVAKLQAEVEASGGLAPDVELFPTVERPTVGANLLKEPLCIRAADGRPLADVMRESTERVVREFADPAEWKRRCHLPEGFAFEGLESAPADSDHARRHRNLSGFIACNVLLPCFLAAIAATATVLLLR